jgi:hypothetical protein
LKFAGSGAKTTTTNSDLKTALKDKTAALKVAETSLKKQGKNLLNNQSTIISYLSKDAPKCFVGEKDIQHDTAIRGL